MPLSPTVAREKVHTRTVTVHGYMRTDGLFDIDGHMTDVKTYDFPNVDRGVIRAGEPLHGMHLRLTIDTTLTILGAEAATEYSPYAICPEIAPAYDRLVGLGIKPGFTRAVKALFAGDAGCTHLTEMLGPMATTAYQTIFAYKAKLRREAGSPPPLPTGKRKRPALLGSCHAFRADGPVVAREWPEFHRPEASKAP